MRPPRILVFGAGAIGQWIGARFAVAGADVDVLCRRAVYEALQARGLRVRDANGGWIEARSARAAESLDALRGVVFDWVFVTVKAFDVRKGVEELQAAGLLTPETRVMGFQNGVGTEDDIAAVCTPARTYVCVVTRPIALGEQPGEVAEASTKGGIAIAPYLRGGSFDTLDPVIGGCGLEVTRFDDYRVMKWSKLLLNMIANATCAILDYSPGELYADRRLYLIEHAAFQEATAVMRAMGVKAADLPGYPARKLWFAMNSLPRPLSQYLLNYKVTSARGSKQPSLRLEMERGRPESEIRWLNGAIVEEARKHGLSAKANAFLTDVLEGIVTGRIPWDTYRRNARRFVEDFRAWMKQTPR